MNIRTLKEVQPIPSFSTVRLTTCGNVSEILFSEHRSAGGYIRKIDKDTYVDTRTGDVGTFQHSTSRASDLANVAKSLKELRNLINANVTDVSFCRWMTLTYRENMTDSERLYRDFKEFNRKARKAYGHYEYITAAEPQGRGAWHLHVLLIFSGKAPYMPNKHVADLWGQGFVTIKRLDDVDNVGAYLTAYLGDLDVSEALSLGYAVPASSVKEVEVEIDGKRQTKRYIKGARLSMYPAGFHIYRNSKGCQKPNIEVTTYAEAKEKAGSAQPTFSRSLSLTSDSFENVLTYEYYNKLRT